MNFKKLLSLAAATAIAAGSFAAMAVTASAASVDDLTTISSNATFIAQDETTATLTKDTLSWGGKLLTLNGDNAYNTAKGYSVLNGTQVQNLLQVKQGRNMAVKVSGACTIDVYHDFNSTRVIEAGSTNRGTEYTVTQAVELNETTNKNYDIDTITVPAAGVVYIGASGDVYVAAIDVKFAGDAPIDEPVVETKYSISVADGIENGSVSINGDVTEAAKGATVNVTATPYNGFVLDKITVNGTPIEGTSFTMPEGDVVVSATFKEYVAPTFDDLPLDTAITFADDGYKKYINLASEAAVNKNSVTVGDTAYTHRLYFAGAISNNHPDRYVTFTPAVDGILEVIAQGGTNTNVRPLAIQQDGFDEQSKIMPTTGDVDIYKYTVKAGVPVKMYSKNSGIGVYSIKLVETPTTTEKSYAFAKTLSDFAGRNSITVNVKGIDIQANNTFDLTRKVAIGNLTGSEEAGLLIGVKLTVDDGLQINSVTIK